MYEVIETPTDPTTIATDDRQDFEAAKKAWNEDVRAIHDAVRGFAEVVTNSETEVFVRATVPFRVTAYRFDLLTDKIEDMGLSLPGAIEDTGGWRDLSDKNSTTYRTFTFSHRDVRAEQWKDADGAEEMRSSIERTLVRNIGDAVIDTLQNGEAEQTIDGWRYEEVADEDPDVAVVDDPEAATPPSKDDLYREEKVEYPAGKARYKVDAIVPPGEWDSDL